MKKSLNEILDALADFPGFQAGLLCFSITQQVDTWAIVGKNRSKAILFLSVMHRFDKDPTFREEMLTYIKDHNEEFRAEVSEFEDMNRQKFHFGKR